MTKRQREEEEEEVVEKRKGKEVEKWKMSHTQSADVKRKLSLLMKNRIRALKETFTDIPYHCSVCPHLVHTWVFVQKKKDVRRLCFIIIFIIINIIQLCS